MEEIGGVRMLRERYFKKGHLSRSPRTGELSSHGRKNNCQVTTTGELGTFDGVQSSEWPDPSNGNLGVERGRS